MLDSDRESPFRLQSRIRPHGLGSKGILRTKDYLEGQVSKPEIEDLLRETLVAVARADLGWDVSAVASQQPIRPIVKIFEDNITGFSKYKLAKAFLRWSREHIAADLSDAERRQWQRLISAINAALK
jgi:hypothetical protein